MTPLAASPDAVSAQPQFQLALACVLAALGSYYLLPRPRGRSLLWGTFLSLAALVAFAAFAATAFGDPARDVVGQVLFWLFAAGALGFGTVLVVQTNPARGAIAFAFVVLSTCGLFLLLAAPFLMAATVIIYAGAIIVTFLFVLMLSHAGGPSAENDRTREPLLGSLAGFAFAGLVLFTLLDAAGPEATAAPLPAPPLSAADRATLAEVDGQLRQAMAAETREELLAATKPTRDRLADVVGPVDAGTAGRPTLQERLKVADADARVQVIIRQADALRDRSQSALDAVENKLLGANPDLDAAKAEVRRLRADVVLLYGRGEIPARNVGTIGMMLYSEHLIAVELAGTLLLVATIGAVAIAQRKGAGA